jgi:CRP/FNR family transcriptional regulator, cyclic AMP receptor protein
MNGDGVVAQLAELALFADLSWPDVERVAHTFEEEAFEPGRRVLRQGLSGSALYVILEGSATVTLDGEEGARLGRGDFFGEISVLIGEAPTADVHAATLLRCLVVPGTMLEEFLLEHPPVMLRMLKAEARRVRGASRWR